MPIAIADYTPAVCRFLKARELACVFVITTRGGKPARFGQATDLPAHFSTMQSQHPYPLELHHVVWTPGRLTALAIIAKAAEMLEKKKLRGQWFEIDATEAIENVNGIVSRNYAGAMMTPHDRFIEQLTRAIPERAKSKS